MNKKYKILFSLVFLITFCIILKHLYYIQSESIVSRADIDERKLTKEEKEQAYELYRLNFKLSENFLEQVNTYAPEYNFLDKSGALYYFNLFEFDNFLMETDEYYYAENDECYFYVYKYDSKIKYVSKIRDKNASKIDDQEAMKIGTDFIKSKFSYLAYDEIDTIENKNYFVIKYIDNIDKIKNHTFNTKVVVDRYGNILEAEYSFINFDKLGVCKTKTMEDAFFELPINYDPSAVIYLNGCDLVYIYENSILQPAYSFEGTTSTGDYFKSNINAALFY